MECNMKQLLILIFTCSSLLVMAQKNTQGFYFGAALAGGTIYYDEDNLNDRDASSGLDLRLGYGVGKTTTLFLGFGGYSVSGQEEDLLRENYTLGLAELGAKFHLGAQQKSPVWYLEAALQGAVADYSKDFNLNLKGAGIGLGGGVMFYIGDVLSIDVGLRGSWGSINEIELGNFSEDISGEGFGYSFTRFNVGISWYPFRKDSTE